jgi:SAM-dependent MidA family methyltransferase
MAAQIDSALARLVTAGASGMGDLFKVMAVSDPALVELAGLPAQTQDPSPSYSAPC